MPFVENVPCCIDRFTERIIARVDERLRGHCQDPECFSLAVVSSVKTSLAFCAHHWNLRKPDPFRNYDLLKAEGLI